MHMPVCGLDRSEGQLERWHAKPAHTRVHPGNRSNGFARAQIVSGPDFVLIVTDVNSHGAVLLAKRLCRRAKQPYLMLRRCGSARFQALLADLSANNLRAAS